MKKIVIAIVVLLILPCLAYSQAADEVVLDGFAVTGKYLNDQIMGDTTNAGARVNANRTYVLKRDAIYLCVSSIRNTSWMLRIKAQAGTGKKPVVYSFKNPTTGTYSNAIFDVRGDISLKNLALVGWSTLDADISVAPNYVLNTGSNNNRIEIDSCLIIAATQAMLRFPNQTKFFKLTNTITAQQGNLYATNIGNGRPIDFRNVAVDTTIIQNCTFLDGTDRIVRHYSSVGALNYFTFDHNTIVNSLSMHGCMGLGIVGAKVTITNNLFVDNFALGNDSSDVTRLTEFGDTKERGPSSAYRMTFVGSVPDTAGQVVLTQWVVKNNFYSVTPALQTWYDSKPNLGLGNLIPLTWHINKKLGADSVNAFKKETITFTKVTKNLVPFATWYYDPNGGNKQKIQTGFGAAVDYARPQWQYYLDTLNLRFQTTAAAYTGADGGKPAGSLMWWGLPLTSVENPTDLVPQSYSLNQNYPNPFNPNTKISFSIPHTGRVALKVFNVLGQELRTLTDAQYPAGTHEVDFDASSLSSGVYIYMLTAGDFVASKKMTLLK